MKKYKRKIKVEDDEAMPRGIKSHRDRPILLERQAMPEHFSDFFMRIYSDKWKGIKKYCTVAEARQGYESLMHSQFNRCFNYRLVTPVGVVTLPVVKV